MLSAEIERLTKMNEKKNQKIDELSNDIQNLKGQIDKLKPLEQENNNLQNLVNLKEGEIEN